MQDEREAAVELLKPARVGERFLAERFRKRARSLATRGTKQIEILPIERAAIFGTGNDNQSDQAVVMDKRYARPSIALVAQPFGNGNLTVALTEHPAPRGIEVEDSPILLDRIPETAYLVCIARRRR